MTLSGGQKARISLARALFSNSQVYLIDNILCSVDQNVSDRIFKSAIREVLGNKTVLFVTNNIQVLYIFYIRFFLNFLTVFVDRRVV